MTTGGRVSAEGTVNAEAVVRVAPVNGGQNFTGYIAGRIAGGNYIRTFRSLTRTREKLNLESRKWIYNRFAVIRRWQSVVSKSRGVEGQGLGKGVAGKDVSGGKSKRDLGVRPARNAAIVSGVGRQRPAVKHTVHSPGRRPGAHHKKVIVSGNHRPGTGIGIRTGKQRSIDIVHRGRKCVRLADTVRAIPAAIGDHVNHSLGIGDARFDHGRSGPRRVHRGKYHDSRRPHLVSPEDSERHLAHVETVFDRLVISRTEKECHLSGGRWQIGAAGDGASQLR